MARGLKPGLDPEATPHCVGFCISGALTFGDLDDGESSISKLIRDNDISCLQEELETDPSVYYVFNE